MNKKEWLMVLAVGGLLTVYVIFFTDWFKSKPLHIYHTMRPIGMAMRNPKPSAPEITFGFDDTVRLTEIKVVPVTALATNDHPIAVWHLVSASNSVPCKMFHYGQNIRGMKSLVPGSHPKPLETNVAYRLFVTAGKSTGQHDFTMGSK